ncbi:MAG TPA: hypothetical protein VD838_21850 [Anaeromyxobacteraceae bacterium]|nr:hypothetical protein [Anaeromyxobacteraceae bacterium]
MITSTLLLAALAAEAPFPVPRAQQEFDAAVPHVADFCQGVAGNVTLFQRGALPFAPLDLQVRRAKGDEADRLRNLWLGIAGASCSVDVPKLSKDFHCGPRCVGSRRADLVRKLPAIRTLVKAFHEAKNVQVVASWGAAEWRVNDLFHRPTGALTEARPSTAMAFVPSGAWKPWPRFDAWASAAKVDAARANDLVARVQSLSLAAIVRDRGAIRVIRIGLGDNESGLLFQTSADVKPPKLGETTGDGRTFVVVEPLAPGVVFYETT